MYFTDRTCFVLTDAGIAAAKARGDVLNNDLSIAAAHDSLIQLPTSSIEHHNGSGNGWSKGSVPIFSGPKMGTDPEVPCWDQDRRMLFFGGQLVKRFRWQAVNQEAILSAFQEEGWPTRIDDPLTPSQEIVAKRRLSDTIKCLNRGRANPLLRFGGDGTGEGVIWEPLAQRAVNVAAT
jgi:hypothetical protein